MSQASVESLQKQLANKEAQLRKYQDLLQRAKEAQLERSNVDREENSKLSFHVEELRSARDCLTTRNALLEQQLRETLDQATVEAARATESSQARLFTSEDMEEAIAEKERARLHLQTLVRRLEADNHELQQEMDVLKQASLENAVELKSLRDDYKELEEKANTVVRELDVANRQLENVQNECRRLSKELKERNTEIKDKTDRELSLTHALRAVKDEMIGEVSRLTVHKHDG